jgi:hypothetical protein
LAPLLLKLPGGAWGLPLLLLLVPHPGTAEVLLVPLLLCCCRRRRRLLLLLLLPPVLRPGLLCCWMLQQALHPW